MTSHLLPLEHTVVALALNLPQVAAWSLMSHLTSEQNCVRPVPNGVPNCAPEGCSERDATQALLNVELCEIVQKHGLKTIKIDVTKHK